MDPEKQAALRELQTTYVTTSNALKQLDAQRRASEVALRRAVITAAELDSLPPEAATYRNLGKAYVLTPKETVMAWLEDVAGKADKDIKGAAGRKEALEGQLSRTEKEMKEVLGIKA